MMLIKSWLQEWWLGHTSWLARRTAGQRGGVRRRRARPLTDVEMLEVRIVPAVITVNSNDDSNTFDPGDGIGIFHPFGRDSDNILTFREAVQIVNAGSTFGYSTAEIAQVSGTLGTDDVIRFASSLTATPVTIGVVNGVYQLNRSVKINGPGADKLTFDASLKSSIFDVDVGQNVEISGMTLTSGKAADGGVILNLGTLNLSGVTIQNGQATKSGGGILNAGTLTLVGNTTIKNSTAGTSGGGIENQGTLRVNESTIVENFAFEGGGISSIAGTVIVSNSTLASNQAFLAGGGINNQSGAVTVINSTFVGNFAVTKTVARGGAINNQDRLSVIHSTITGNTVGELGGCGGIATAQNGTTRVYNSLVIGNNAGFTVSAPFNDLTGPLSTESFGILTTSQTFAVPNSLTANWETVLDSETVNGILVPKLADNGGPTRTILLKASSPAIDQGLFQNTKFANGDPFLVSQNPQDQRVSKSPRNINAPDLGAVESVPEMLIVNSLADDGGGLLLTLREAVELANAIPGDNTITFGAGLGGTITLTQGELALTDLVGTTRILGPGPNSLAIDGNQTSRIFRVNVSAKAEIAGLTIQNGNAGTGGGGGIFAIGNSSLTVSNATFKNNRAAGDGGGISAGGTLIVGGSTFEGNVAGLSGGGIFALRGRKTSVFSSTFLQNVANGAAGSDLTSIRQNAVNGGGGIAILNSETRIENCTFTGNHAVGVGGGVAVLDPQDSDINIVHSTLTGNTVAVEPGSGFDINGRTVRAQLKGGGLFSQQPKGGLISFDIVEAAGRVAVINTIVAGNVVVGGGVVHRRIMGDRTLTVTFESRTARSSVTALLTATA